MERVRTNLMDHYLNGTKISLTTPKQVLEKIKNYEFKESNYIDIFGLYVLTQSYTNNILQKALNNSFLNPLHGKSIEFYLKVKGYRDIETVDGVFLLEKLLNEKTSHYFYGTNDTTLERIRIRIENEFREATVAGYKSPPLIDIDKIENNPLIKRDIKEINRLKPNIVWIGIGGVKQDLLMYYYHKYFDNSLMIGVGAVFDYFSGNLSLSSDNVKNLGMRWLYRLFLQPRLIKKTLYTIWLSIIYLTKHFIKKIFN